MSSPAQDEAKTQGPSNGPRPGIVRPGSTPEALTFSFDGHSLNAAPGESVAAALTAHGITAWRSTRKGGRPRGLFCGIGVCFDCLVEVDGVANQRACLVEVCEGMSVDGSFCQAEGGQQ